jgi:hypothetical protein
MNLFAIEAYSELEKFNQISREILFKIVWDRKCLVNKLTQLAII